MEWVAKITTVGFEMFLPAVAGGFLDRRLGTGYWAIVGLVLGLTVGFWHLMRMTRPARNRPNQPKGGGTDGGSPDA
jgi:F0F1-type ATP synthase assembly protein I